MPNKPRTRVRKNEHDVRKDLPRAGSNRGDVASRQLDSTTRDHSFQKPISLHGEYLLELPAEFSASAIPAPAESIDLEALLPALGFTDDEARLLVLNQIDGVALCDAAGHLGWSRAMVDKVRKTAARKLRGFGGQADPRVLETVTRTYGSSLHPCVIERFESGRRTYVHATVLSDSAFIEIVNQERCKSIAIIELPEIQTLRHKYRRLILTITISEADVLREQAALQLMKRWHSEEYVNDLARDRARLKAENQREEKERVRVHGLSLVDFAEAMKAIDTDLPKARTAVEDTRKKLAKLRADLQAQRTSGVRELAKFLTSGIAETEQELERLEDDFRAKSRLLTLLREEQVYRQRVTRERETAAAEQKLEAEINRGIVALSKKIAPYLGFAAPGSNLFSDCTTAEQTYLQYIARLLGDFGRMHQGE